MDESLRLGLNLASVVLATITLVVILFSLKNNTPEMKAVKVFLAFLLVCVNVALGMLGNTLSWMIVVLWTTVMVLDLLSLTFFNRK